jgi:hypothetical protein
MADQAAPAAPTASDVVASLANPESNVNSILAGNAAPAQVEAAPTSEPAAKPAETLEDRRFAQKFAALSRKEKQLKDQERKFKAQQAEFDKRSQVIEPPKPATIPLEKRLRMNPFETLKELGLDPETLSSVALNDGKLTPELQMQLMKEELQGSYKSELEQLKAELAAERKAREDAVKTREEESQQVALEEFRGSIGKHIEVNKESLELLAAEGTNGSDLVFEVIDEHFRATRAAKEEAGEENPQGEVMDVTKAAELVENYLLDQAKDRIKLSKIKKLMEPVEPPKTKPDSKSSVTLSNSNAQVRPSTGRFLSDDESKAEAAKLIRWTQE